MAQARKLTYKSDRLGDKDRARVVLCVLWPDSTDIDAIDRLLDASNVTAARSPVHDRDEYDRSDVEKWLWRHGMGVDMSWTVDELRDYCDTITDIKVPWIGDLKKPHYHYVVAFEGNKSLQQCIDLFGGATTYFEKATSKHGSLRYLIHKGKPSKAQYDFDEIRAFGGMDLSCIVKASEVESEDYLTVIEDYIIENECNSQLQLINWARGTKDYNIRYEVRHKMPYFLTLMSSVGWEAKRRREQEAQEAFEREREALEKDGFLRLIDGKVMDPNTGEVLEGFA